MQRKLREQDRYYVGDVVVEMWLFVTSGSYKYHDHGWLPVAQTSTSTHRPATCVIVTSVAMFAAFAPKINFAGWF